MIMKRPTLMAFTLLMFTVLTAATAGAHFPWLDVESDGTPILFFGEDLSDRTYHLPEPLQDFDLNYVDGDGASRSIDVRPVDGDTLVGLRASQSLPPHGTVFGRGEYGVYHGSRLIYYSAHLLGTDPARWSGSPDHLPLWADVTRKDDRLVVRVTWNSKPLEDLSVKLTDDRGREQASATTDGDGRVTFAAKEVPAGLNGLLVGWTDSDASGTVADQKYESTMHYLSVTFRWDPDSKAPPASDAAAQAAAAESVVSVQASSYPDLPVELTSFGGAIAAGQLFVYGGHVGRAHSYSTAEQSDRLWSLDVSRPGKSQWTERTSGTRLQGLAMVPFGESVVRCGGFTAMNAEGQEHDLHSQATVSRFDPAEETWTDLTPLPEPRSSHGAAILGDRVFVIGGWELAGDDDTRWHSTAWTARLGDDPIRWTPIATPPFRRRALSVAAHEGKIFVVGGMDHETGPSTRVDVYDPVTDQWIEAPSLVGPPMTGFGCSAHSLNGQLYVSTVSGNVQRLADQDRWEIVGNYEPGRFFHNMLPVDDRSMVLVGGANMEVGRFTEVEIVRVR